MLTFDDRVTTLLEAVHANPERFNALQVFQYQIAFFEAVVSDCYCFQSR